MWYVLFIFSSLFFFPLVFLLPIKSFRWCLTSPFVSLQHRLLPLDGDGVAKHVTHISGRPFLFSLPPNILPSHCPSASFIPSTNSLVFHLYYQHFIFLFLLLVFQPFNCPSSFVHSILSLPLTLTSTLFFPSFLSLYCVYFPPSSFPLTLIFINPPYTYFSCLSTCVLYSSFCRPLPRPSLLLVLTPILLYNTHLPLPPPITPQAANRNLLHL